MASGTTQHVSFASTIPSRSIEGHVPGHSGAPSGRRPSRWAVEVVAHGSFGKRSSSARYNRVPGPCTCYISDVTTCQPHRGFSAASSEGADDSSSDQQSHNTAGATGQHPSEDKGEEEVDKSKQAEDGTCLLLHCSVSIFTFCRVGKQSRCLYESTCGMPHQL